MISKFKLKPVFYRFPTLSDNSYLMLPYIFSNKQKPIVDMPMTGGGERQ